MIIERSVINKRVTQNDKKPSFVELESILALPESANDDIGQVCLLKDSPFRLIKVSAQS